MRLSALTLFLACWLPLAAQMRMTVDQLTAFVRSSAELKHPDKQVAEYLKKVKLTHRLENAIIEDLQRAGAGPKTVEALRQLQASSTGLPAAPVAAPKPQPPPLPGPSRQEAEKLIEQVREWSLGYSRRLPDFICTQVTRRYIDPTGLEFWQRQDTITARLSYFEQKEDYKIILVNNRVSDTSMEQVGGATSTGEFGTMLREIFERESETVFRWERWATLRGKRAHVFTYFVPQRRSKWTIRYQRSAEIVPAYRGLIYVERDKPVVMRVTLEADDIPPSFPIQQASQSLDYDYAEISGQQYILPLKAVMRMREGKLLVKNEVEFRLYRKFAAEATITFDTPEPLPEEKTKEQPAKP